VCLTNWAIKAKHELYEVLIKLSYIKIECSVPRRSQVE
jgi:hypothetical protein